MQARFSRIILFASAHRANKGVQETLQALQELLHSLQVAFLIESETATYFALGQDKTTTLSDIGETGDLIIVVGGDGSLLNAARQAIKVNVPVLGINRGHLGFLTDVLPEALETKVGEILAGKFTEEKRFLLNATVLQDDAIICQGEALNDIVLLSGETPQLIEFAIYINNQLVSNQRADGMIVTTPTGSTAYALSGGGPILHPGLDAIALVPMCPHTLSSRPIVINGDNIISIVIDAHNETSPRLSCDGQESGTILPGQRIKIEKKAQKLRLIHPLDYNYYETLRAKLGWESKHQNNLFRAC
ncbi:MAG: NAD(+) kinase [Gammaproteobacteria bacterium]